MLVSNEETSAHMRHVCKKSDYEYLITTDPEELLKVLKRMRCEIVFVDDEAVKRYGARIYSRVSVASPACSVILLCDQANRELIKEAMDLGAYASILEPYEEWEVMTIISIILAKKQPKRRKKDRWSRKHMNRTRAF
jgi:DNA-binding NtrC family response regulator